MSAFCGLGIGMFAPGIALIFVFWSYHLLAAALENEKARFLVLSFTSDWLYPSYQSLEIVSALRGRNKDVAYCELPSNYGHDAFLVDVAEQTDLVRGFLASTFKS